MKLKDATPEQVKKAAKMIDGNHKIHGIVGLPTGETFLLFESLRESGFEEEPPIVGYSLRAIPLSLLDEEKFEWDDVPKVILSIFPTDVGSEGRQFHKVVMNHIEKTYPESEPETTFCIELEEIHMSEYRSKGLGSYMLQMALAQCHNTCLECELVITHIFGEVEPADEDRLEDVNRFYRRHGFRETYGEIYRMI